jgi:hypothetical protein
MKKEQFLLKLSSMEHKSAGYKETCAFLFVINNSYRFMKRIFSFTDKEFYMSLSIVTIALAAFGLLIRIFGS